MTAAPGSEAGPRLEVAGLSKTFGGTRVLRDVAFRVQPGELHGLVGQNGSGKSTLVKILTGIYRPDPGGMIAVDGRQLRTPVKPLDARAAGLSVVHQDPGLIDDLTVWENVRVGRYRAAGPLRRIRRKQEIAALDQVLARLDRPLDVTVPVARLTAEERATVAIARALQDHRPGGGLILFDESTRALGREARDRFFRLVRSLLGEGTSVLLISHQLEEVVRTTDRVTVLRDGAPVEVGIPTCEADEASLTRMMLGRHLVHHERVSSAVDDTVAVSVRGVSTGVVDGFSTTLRRGEIVGLTGLLGSGFEEAAETLAGARRANGGELTIGERTLELSAGRGSVEEFVSAGIAFVPERRMAEGLAGEMTLAENLTLPRLRSRGKAWWSGRQWQLDEARRMIDKLDIRPPNPAAPVATLSGGNQQKVLLGKWLAGDPALLILQEPTQAVDVGARHDIIDAIRGAARDGCCVFVASVDAADLSVLCDRVLVFRDGRVINELTGTFDPDDIIHATFGDPAAVA